MCNANEAVISQRRGEDNVIRIYYVGKGSVYIRNGIGSDWLSWLRVVGLALCRSGCVWRARARLTLEHTWVVSVRGGEGGPSRSEVVHVVEKYARTAGKNGVGLTK